MKKAYIELAGGFFACYMFCFNLIATAYDSIYSLGTAPHIVRKQQNEWLAILKMEMEREEQFHKDHGFQDVLDFVRELKA